MQSIATKTLRLAGTSLARRLCGALMIGALAQPAVSQTDYVARANGLYRDVPAARAGHNELLMGLVDLAPPPSAVRTPEQAALLPHGSAAWAAAEAWATGAGQKQALRALRAFSVDPDHQRMRVFAQPYGTAGIPSELIAAGLYTSLGNPELLAAADFQYLEKFSWLRSLVHVESTRLTQAGKAAEALDLLVAQLAFGRQMMDREFFAECVFGIETVIETFRRMRDVMYLDHKGPGALDANAIKLRVGLLGADDGVVELERFTFPSGNRVAAEQLVAEMYDPGGRPNDDFGRVLMRLSSGSRPLKRFGLAERARSAAEEQLGYTEILGEIDALFKDWTKRWTLNIDDRLNAGRSAFEEFDRDERQAVFLAAESRLGDRIVSGDELYDLRQVIDAERAGTRMAMGVVAFRSQYSSLPQTLRTVRPAFVTTLDGDTFHRNSRGRQEIKFFVPVRDPNGQPIGEERQPYDVEVTAGGEDFEVTFDESTFLLYSVGRNGRDDFAKEVTGDPEDRADDYLYWPPVMSLLREHLEQSGAFD
ncbi:MAG: hypothetical protein AAGI17_01310 [Planctomycetota bacterium]